MWVMMGIYGTWSYLVTWYPMIRCPISSIPGAISQIVNNSLYTLHTHNPNNVCSDFPLGVCPRLHKPLFLPWIPLNLPNSMAQVSGLLELQSEPATTPFLNLDPFKPGSLQNHLIKMWEQGSYERTILPTKSRGAYQALFIPYSPFEEIRSIMNCPLCWRWCPGMPQRIGHQHFGGSRILKLCRVYFLPCGAHISYIDIKNTSCHWSD